MNFAKMSDYAVLAELGERLRRERLNANIARKHLAEQTGLSLKTIQNAEDGKNFSMETLIRILRGLRRVNQLESFLPDPGLSPVQLAKLKGKVRQRATGSRTSEKGTAVTEKW